MPTINKYKNQRGFYIRARPPSVSGMVTYNIRYAGYPLIDKMGFSDGEEISWDTIEALKSLGLIYTNDSGTITDDEFEPDSNYLDKFSLTKEEANRLVSSIRETLDVSDQKLSEISTALDLDSVPSDEEPIDERQESNDDSSNSRDEIPVVDQHTKTSRIKKNRVYTGKVDRISNSGNGIIKTSMSFINIGPTHKSAVGERVQFKYGGNGMATLVTQQYIPESIPRSEYPGLTDSQKDLLEKL